MSAPPHPISPPPGHGTTDLQSTGVRRHHTITAASRTARTATRAPISEESQEQQTLNDEEVVDPEWVRSVGAVGEKGSLHRQNSLPARYNRGVFISFISSPPIFPAVSPSVTGGVSLTVFPQAYGHGSRGSGGSITPRTLNSLSAIAGHEGEEDEWESELRDLRHEDEVFLPHTQKLVY